MITVGIDEVGRGCWAGPLVAAAVVLGLPIAGLKDSKKLSRKRREVLAVEIRHKAVAIGVGWVEPAELDVIGLTAAVRLAMQRAASQIDIPYDEIIIDGNYNYFAYDKRARAVIKADDSVPSVSAASIIAKVARDAYMSELDEQYCGYGFESHVGYGTRAHIEALDLLGVTDIHRKSFKPVQAFLAPA